MATCCPSVSSTGQPSVDNGSPNGGLSSGAKIGLGVGIPLGLLLIGGSVAAAFLLGRRRRRSRQSEDANRTAGSAGSRKSLPVQTGGPAHHIEMAEADDGDNGRSPR
ncbi:hypothetical protein PG994_013962 [Apiospora phragmitis]|uniref:Uncharacterized protein n=1 Tax=Apiospora phragmitis TaxID=2905665 RepID=A0ABR1T4Q6_9PEZI